jgi:O-antigen/teichoic acid export membrane protein
MSVRKAFLSEAVKLGTGQIVTQLCSFVRSVILARLISPENFGIAATFAMTYALMEMVSNVSAQTLLVQAPDGDNPSFQGTGHLVIACRGMLSAAVLLVLASPVSLLFGVPQARWAFYWIAAIPLLRGFAHLDLSRFQRNMRFTPQIAVDSISSLLVTVLAWPLAAWLRNYAAMLWLLLLQAAFYAIGSHVVAERPYVWTRRRDYVRRFLVFGWPLLINGLLMYGILQGDRFVIGVSGRVFPQSTFTLTDLGIYSVAFAVTMAPSTLFTNIANSLFLPVLARAQAAPEQFVRRYMACAQILAFAAAVIAIPFIVAGHWIVPLVYGPKYSAAGAFIGWLGAMWGTRVFRTAPTQAALALGDSRNSMIANTARTTALIGVLIAAATGSGLIWIAICGFSGEVLATTVCIWRLWARHHVAPGLSLAPFAVSGMGMVVALIVQLGTFSRISTLVIGVVLLAICGGSMVLCFPNLRHNLRGLLRLSTPPVAAQSARS